LALITCFASGAQAEDDKKKNDIDRYKWFLTAYAGAHAQDDINDVVTLQPKFEDNAYIGVVALARELWHYEKYLSFELEGQVAKHFNKDTQWEFVGVLIGRWHYFPWNNYVNTSFAVGDGMSYYTKVSEVEEEDDEDAQQALNYLLIEVANTLIKTRTGNLSACSSGAGIIFHGTITLTPALPWVTVCPIIQKYPRWKKRTMKMPSRH
jgi:hypothetical protein